MKSLFIVRHAKSSWDYPHLRDFERPLNDRGRKNAPEMGKRLKKRSVKPQLIVSSPANRALSTAQLIAQELDYPFADIVKEPNLYHASSRTISKIVSTQPDHIRSLMIFGHNPGLTDFANDLLNHERIDNVPTSGVVAFNLPINSWKEIQQTHGQLFFFDFPKKSVNQ
jgi:phosphohistidine phosphatase